MKSKIINFLYLFLALVGMWFLVRFWIPGDYAIAGHDSGLALRAGDFLTTRLNAWDDRINFGVDNSPHLGSVVLHSIDYLLSIVGGTLYSGNRLAVFFWLSAIFLCGFTLSLTMEVMTGKYFKFFFPIFITFNFYIFQSIFILERAKYELYCVLLIFLALVFKTLNEKGKSVVRYSIIFSILLSVFNGGSWLGLPLYGGFLVTATTVYLSVLFYSLSKKNYDRIIKLSKLYLFSFILFILINAYSILPYLATLKSSAYGQLVDAGIIQAGMEWLNYISRGSSFLNLFKLQGIPDWYLTEFLPNTQHTYSGIYMTSPIFIFLSFAFPAFALFSLFLSKKKTEKHIISLTLLILLVSMFFSAGPNSPLGFIYNFLYKKIPGFSIFRSPYFKFGYVHIISFMFLLSYSFSKTIDLLVEKYKSLSKFGAPFLIFLIISGWLGFYNVIFSSQKLFNWQPDKSTLIKIPSYINEFDSWMHSQEYKNGRILLLPPLDNDWMAENYYWGYWSLSTVPSVTFSKAEFIINDTNLIGDEKSWVAKLYTLLEEKNFTAFENLSSKLGIKYVLLRSDFISENIDVYLDLIVQMKEQGKVEHVKSFGDWDIYKLNDVLDKPLISASVELAKISDNYFHFPIDLSTTEYSKYLWLKFEETESISDLNFMVKKEFYSTPCVSCQIENLGRYAKIPAVTILPNSPLYIIKKGLQDNLIKKSPDQNSLLNSFLDLILIKLSETKSMESMNVDKKYISDGLNDMLNYLTRLNSVLENSSQLNKDFYLASVVYEKLNPVQRNFRDVVAANDFQYEREDIRDLTIKILWEVNLIKKYFNPLTSQDKYWNNEKFFDLDELSDGVYKLLLNGDSFPVDEHGVMIKPIKLSTTSGQEIKINQKDFIWLETEYFEKNKLTNGLQFSFPQQQSLFLSRGNQLMDFPEGQRGCSVGNISYFNKNKMYKIKLQSNVGRKNVRLYIDEKEDNEKGFLRGDIVNDVFLANPTSTFVYVFDPNASADNPLIYLCENDTSFPETETIEVYEMFLPIVFAEKNVSENTYKMPVVNFEQVNKSEFKISVTDSQGPFVLVFNQRFNSLWRLLDEKGNIAPFHFSVDGYANGWLLNGSEEYNMKLQYYPNILFKYGLWISLASLVASLIIYYGKHD